VRSKVRIIGGDLSGDQVAWSSGFWLSLDGSLTENILPPATAGSEAQRKADNRNRLQITVRRNPADLPVSRDISINGAPASWLDESELSVWLGDAELSRTAVPVSARMSRDAARGPRVSNR
jgi:hypothetical protein